nr:Chain P, mupain-1-IG [synthetic construct]6A8N_C Chain C, CYS-PRO-ALA-TYR-SER-ARG-TYR-ILE-GLY-CYS [Phage display vector pTDisp]6A8N_P Chain P, CYS-PRO-ALA-TYR-SER-ARG-TYR-ILE-GLY-CYS [Phage display vector pTDisp]
CPAYSRYIGC